MGSFAAKRLYMLIMQCVLSRADGPEQVKRLQAQLAASENSKAGLMKVLDGQFVLLLLWECCVVFAQ